MKEAVETDAMSLDEARKIVEAHDKKGMKVKLTGKKLKEIATVLGTCDCGKPAQVMGMKEGKVVYFCFGCSEAK